MYKQSGSIILILLIIISLTSITSFAVLQINLQSNKQLNLNNLHSHASQFLSVNIQTKLLGLSSGIDFNNLPVNETSNHQIDNHNFLATKNLKPVLTINYPLTGYSLNSIYHTRIIELDTSVSSSMVKTASQKIGLGCLETSANVIPDQIDSAYLLDLDQNTNIDVTYQFDSSSGKIWRNGAQTELLFDLGFDLNQSFSRPDFVLINFGQTTKLAISFVVQNTGNVPVDAENTLYLLLDKALFGLTPTLPLNATELIDLQTNPVLSTDDKGYFLELNQGQLISSALTTIDQELFVITQSPTVDPDTGLTEYINKFIHINLTAGLEMVSNTQFISGSSDLLVLELNTINPQIFSLATQHEVLRNLNGECRRLYQYEDFGI